MFASVSSRSFAELDFAGACKQALESHFDRIEVWLDQAGTHLAAETIAADPDGFANRLREATRITPVAFQLEGPIAPATFAGLCRACKCLRITQITIPASVLGTPFNEEIDRLRDLTKVAGQDGVRVSVKTETGRLTQDIRTAVELCQNVPGLGLTLDPSYFLADPLGDRVLELAAPHTFHVHLRDSTPSEVQVPVGLGEVDYAKIIAQLKRVDYQRALSVELIPSLIAMPQRGLELRKLRMLLESLL